MVKIVELLKKPVLLSTLICILLFYSKIIPVKEYAKYYSLIPQDSVSILNCQLINSPVRNSKGNFYIGKCKIFEVKSESKLTSSAKGFVNLYIPAELAEAYYPGKLYSTVKNNNIPLFEAGGRYLVKGNYSNNNFYVSNCLNSFWDNTFFGKIDYFRALCRLQFKRLMYSWGDAGGFLLALLCGAKEYTNIDIANNFKNSGLSHILALSGMHLSMFSSIAMIFGKKIKRKKLSYVIRLIFLYLFVWFAGFSPSLLRAYICSMLALISTMTGTDKPDMKMILCFSFILQTIISPQDINNIGFILSYTALAGILIFNKYFYKFLIKIFPSKLAGSLSASTSAQIFTAPISLSLFGVFSPIGIIATTIISPIVTIFIYSGLILILISLLIPTLSVYSAYFVNFLYNTIKFAVAFFAKAPIWSLN